MTNKQPEALRLAYLIEGGWTRECDRKAAVELRRLHEVNSELVGAIANLIKVKGRHNTEIAYQRLVAVYDKAQGENNER